MVSAIVVLKKKTTHDPTYFRDLANRQSEEDLANRQRLTGQRQFNLTLLAECWLEFIQNLEIRVQQPNSNPRRNSSLEVGNNDSSEDSDSEEDLANLPSRYTY